MKYKTLMGLSTLALASFIFSAEASAETKQPTPTIVQQQVETGGVKQATMKQMTSQQSAKQLKKVKALSALPTASSKAELTDAILKEMRAFNETINIEYDGTLTMDEILDALHGANKDTYVYGTRAGGSYGYSSKSGKFVVTITMTYNHTKEQEAELTTAVENITKDIIQPSMSDIEKIKAVNDYVVTHTVYSKTGTKTTPHSPYTIISEGKGVCQAYALLTYRLLEEAGIENMYVTGYAGEAHAWNLVKVDGNWYHLDTTWNDPLFSNADPMQETYMKDYISYNYFLISDATIFADHQIDPGYPTSANADYISGLAKTITPILTVSDKVGEKYLMSHTVYVNGAWYATNSQYQLVKIENNNMSVLSTSAKKIYGVTYANNKIFYRDTSNLYAYNLATNEEETLAKGKIQKIVIEDGMLKAYANGSVIYSENLMNNDKTTEEINPEQQDEVSEPKENIYQQAFGELLAKVQQDANNIHVQDEAIQEAYDQIIQKAEVMYENPTQEDIDWLQQQKKQAFEMYFVNGQTKTALQYQSDVAYGLYAATAFERFDALVNVRAQAASVLENEDATSEEIQQAIYEVKQAIFNAKSKFDKTALLALIEQARTAGNLDDLVKQAQAVVEQDDASEAQIQAVTDLLEEALNKTEIPEEEQQILGKAVDEMFICRYPDFGKLAEKLFEQLNQYTDEQKKHLSTETLEKIEEVQKRHTKMKTFEESLDNKQAWTASPKKTTNALKPWTISLSTPVAHTVQNAKYIKVYDMFGDEIEVEVSLNGKQITITPQQQYESEMMYTLSIDKNLTSQSGKKLKNDIYLQFQFEKQFNYE